MSSKFTHACAWCKRETVDGIAVGAPMSAEKYQAASHGGCIKCMEAFERDILTPKRLQQQVQK